MKEDSEILSVANVTGTPDSNGMLDKRSAELQSWKMDLFLLFQSLQGEGSIYRIINWIDNCETDRI